MSNFRLTQTGTELQADLNKVEGMAEIKTIGSGLTLSSSGELSASGGSGLPTITIAASQVISQDPVQVQLTDEQYAAMYGRSVIIDASALNMPIVVANFNGEYTDNETPYLNFVFIYCEGSESFTDFNRISINTSTKVAELSFDSVTVSSADIANTADSARYAEHTDKAEYSTAAPGSANTSGYLKIAILSSEPAKRYGGWLYLITSDANYSGAVTYYRDTSFSSGTSIKFDAPPTSEGDYDSSVSGTGTGGVVFRGNQSFFNKTKVYVWGGYVKINNVVTAGGNGYSNAVEITLEGNYDISLAAGTMSA